MVIFTLILVNVDLNWNFPKYGTIGKHPMQSLYTGYYRTLCKINTNVGIQKILMIMHNTKIGMQDIIYSEHIFCHIKVE